MKLDINTSNTEIFYKVKGGKRTEGYPIASDYGW